MIRSWVYSDLLLVYAKVHKNDEGRVWNYGQWRYHPCNFHFFYFLIIISQFLNVVTHPSVNSPVDALEPRTHWRYHSHNFPFFYWLLIKFFLFRKFRKKWVWEVFKSLRFLKHFLNSSRVFCIVLCYRDYLCHTFFGYMLGILQPSPFFFTSFAVFVLDYRSTGYPSPIFRIFFPVNWSLTKASTW